MPGRDADEDDGDPDHDFAMMMTSHHKSTVDMSEAMLQHGSDPKIKEMARKIVDSQKKEIAEFEAWMKQRAHGGASTLTTAHYRPCRRVASRAEAPWIPAGVHGGRDQLRIRRRSASASWVFQNR